MPRRTPSGQLQRFYKRLYDLYSRYPKRWAQEKGYSDVDWYVHHTEKLLKGLKAGLEGRPLPDTGERPDFRGGYRMPRPDLGRRVEQVHDPRGFAHLEDPDQEMYDPEEEYEPVPPPRNMITRSSGGRFVPKKSKSRSVRPAFLRRK
ncbi:hypothetical protein L0244_36705 [bacterium]|nr:hypothetical protein [bacterium]